MYTVKDYTKKAFQLLTNAKSNGRLRSSQPRKLAWYEKWSILCCHSLFLAMNSYFHFVAWVPELKERFINITCSTFENQSWHGQNQCYWRRVEMWCEGWSGCESKLGSQKEVPAKILQMDGMVVFLNLRYFTNQMNEWNTLL